MYSNIVRAIPFNRISQVLTPGISTIPQSILQDISNKYVNIQNKVEYYSNGFIQNDKPLITSYSNFRELFANSKSIVDYKPLHKEVKSILVQGYYRDVATCSIPEKQMVIMRVWFNYNCQNKLIKFINVFELTNNVEWCIDTQRYLELIKNQLLVPSFDDIINGNDNFIRKLQIMV